MSRERLDKGTITPGAGAQEFEIDRDYYSFDETLTPKVN